MLNQMARNLDIDDRPTVPSGVVAASVVLAVMAFIGLLIAAACAYLLFGTENAVIPHILSVRVIAIGLDALIVALVVLAICTIVGLSRLKVWSRYSITLLGLLDLIVFGLLTAGVLIARVKSGFAALTVPNNPGLTVGEVLVGLAIFFALLALIGVWWILYFNTDHTRMVFRHAQAGIPVPDPESKSFLGQG
jgi:hypothetical protein